MTIMMMMMMMVTAITMMMRRKMVHLQPGSLPIGQAMKLKQGWNIGKSNVELWVPLENAAAVTHPPIVSIPETMAAIRAKLSKTSLIMKSGQY